MDVIAETRFGIQIYGHNSRVKFKALISDVHAEWNKGKSGKDADGVVVLIDEYDYPIRKNIQDIELAKKIRDILWSFYGTIKSSMGKLRFTFMTGISKFAPVSIFSNALEQLVDITMHRRYSTICGVTTEEMDLYFAEHLEDYLRSADQTVIDKPITDLESLKNAILGWYDGYSWDGSQRVLNPFSLLNLLDKKKFAPYWEESGSTSLLTNLLKVHGFPFDILRKDNYITEGINTVDIGKLMPIPLMFQTGYLTIAEIAKRALGSEEELYKLGIPNQEIRSSLFTILLTDFFSANIGELKLLAKDLREAFIRTDPSGAEKAFSAFLLHIPSSLDIPQRKYWHALFLSCLHMLGRPLEIEETAAGEVIDAVLELPDGDIFVIEIRRVKLRDRVNGPDRPDDSKAKESASRYDKFLDRGVKAALKQIEIRNSCEKYTGRGKTVWKTAIVVCDRTRVRVVFEKAGPDS
jgi:hypothetical protein